MACPVRGNGVSRNHWSPSAFHWCAMGYRLSLLCLAVIASHVDAQAACPAIHFFGADVAVLAPRGGMEIIAGGVISGSSFTGGRISSRNYEILGAVPNFLDLLLPCTPRANGLGSVKNKVPGQGAGSQYAQAADLTGVGEIGPTLRATDGVVLAGRPDGILVFTGTLGRMTPIVQKYTTGTRSLGVLVVDLSGDGKPDIVVAYQGNGTLPGGVSILLGNGNSTFRQAVNYPLGIYVTAAAIGDFNGDGKPDITVASEAFAGVAILLGNGDGTFRTGTPASINAPGALSVTVADLNKDGKADLAAAAGDGVSILLGRGDGTFQTAVRYPAQRTASYVRVADFNSDGFWDLAIANQDSSSVSILIGKGDGSFRSGLSYAVASSPEHLIIADLNNDGHADVVVGTGSEYAIGPSYPSGRASVLLGRGDATFQGAVVLTVAPGGSGLSAVAAADFNRDGSQDLVSASSTGVTVFRNTGAGSIEPLTPIAVGGGVQSLVAADFNNDGRADIAYSNDGIGNGTIGLMLGRGDGTFATPTTYPVAGWIWYPLAVADFNADGKLDVAVTKGSGTDGVKGNISVFLGNGDGTLRPPVNYEVGLNARQLVAADFDGNGKPDLAVVNWGAPQTTPGHVSILTAKADGTFNAAVSLTAGVFPMSIASGDINGDGKIDLAVGTVDQAYSNYSIAVFIGKGDGTFQAPRLVPSLRGPNSILIGDFNADQKADLVIAHGRDMSSMPGNGDGTFQAQVPLLGNSSAMAALDLNADGKLDLAVVGPYELTTFINASTAPQAVANVNAAGFEAGPLAPESIVSAFGAHLATGTLAAAETPLPTTLGGTTITVKDAAGTTRLAPLFYVSPLQVNYQIPPGTVAGTASVTVASGDGVTSSTNQTIAAVAPGLFTLNKEGLVAATVLRIKPDNTQIAEAVFEVNPITQQIVALPIDLGPSTDRVYLILYGTGIRFRQGDAAVRIGTYVAPVQYAGPQGGFVGLDQVNVLLGTALAGKGKTSIVLTVDGVTANTVDVSFK